MNQHTQIIHELTQSVKRKDIVMRKLKKNVSASDFNDLDISLANLQNLLWVYIELNDEFRKVIPSGEDCNGKYYQGRLDMADSQLKLSGFCVSASSMAAHIRSRWEGFFLSPSHLL